MSIRRSRLDMILRVLEAIIGGTEKPTRIMYETGLSWNALKEILSSLASQGFIEEVNDSRLRSKRNRRAYRITRKGENVVQYYRNAEQLLKIDTHDPTRG